MDAFDLRRQLAWIRDPDVRTGCPWACLTTSWFTRRWTPAGSAPASERANRPCPMCSCNPGNRYIEYDLGGGPW